MNHSFFKRFKEGLVDSLYIWRQEMKNTFTDAGMLIFFILVPLFYPLLYSFIYNQEVVRDVPVVVVDQSHSSLSREFIRKINASGDLNVVSYCNDLKEVKEALRRKDAYGAILIPPDFSDQINKGIQTHVTIYCDMVCMLYYKAMLTNCTDVSLDMNKSIKIKRMGKYTQEDEKVNSTPMEYTSVALFNPQTGFASFLIPAVLILILQQTLLLGVGMSAGTARERNRHHDLITIGDHTNGSMRIVIGKSLAYFMIYIVMSTYVLCAVPHFFNLIQLASFGTIIAFLIPYLLACIFFAMTLSATIRNRETCILIFVFTSVPVLFLSGISWPGAAIPTFWKVISWIVPSTFGINGYVHINTMGASLGEISYEYLMLWLQAAFYFITTCLVYYYQILISRGYTDKRILRYMIGMSSRKRKKNKTINTLHS